MGCAVETPEQDCCDTDMPGPRPYRDLPPEAQDRARDEWREKGWDWDQSYSEMLTDHFAEVLKEEYGFEVAYRTEKYGNGKTHNRPDMEWDLSCGQGEGVSFSVESVDLKKVASKNKPIAEQLQLLALLEAAYGSEASFDLSVSHGDGKYWRVDPVDGDFDDIYREMEPNQQVLVDEICLAIEAELEQFCEDACHRLKKIGYAEIDYRNSDECIAETLGCNDFLFDEEGELV